MQECKQRVTANIFYYILLLRVLHYKKGDWADPHHPPFQYILQWEKEDRADNARSVRNVSHLPRDVLCKSDCLRQLNSIDTHKLRNEKKNGLQTTAQKGVPM